MVTPTELEKLITLFLYWNSGFESYEIVSVCLIIVFIQISLSTYIYMYAWIQFRGVEVIAPLTHFLLVYFRIKLFLLIFNIFIYYFF